MEKENAKLRLWSNASQVKTKNKSITVFEGKKDSRGEGLIIQFRKIAKEPEKPACEHIAIKGVIRQTTIKLSPIGFDALLLAMMEYKKMKHKQSKIKKDE